MSRGAVVRVAAPQGSCFDGHVGTVVTHRRDGDDFEVVALMVRLHLDGTRHVVLPFAPGELVVLS